MILRLFSLCCLCLYLLGCRPPLPEVLPETPRLMKRPPEALTITREIVNIHCEGKLTLEGELTLPGNLGYKEQRPAILLLPGSGLLDRDVTLPSKYSATDQPIFLFRQIADTLTRAGFIVLRYDKRGVQQVETAQNISLQYNRELWKTATRESLLSDAAHAVSFLQADPRVHSVSLLGHSEGASLAIALASQETNIQSLFLLGAPARNLRDILYFQYVTRDIEDFRLLLDPDDNKRASLADAKALYPYLGNEQLDPDQDGEVSLKELTTALQSHWEHLQQKIENETSETLLEGFSAGWYRSWYNAQDNLSLLPQLRELPILILQGEDDRQTPLETEAIPLVTALRQQKHKQLSFLRYPGLGHGFSQRRDLRPTLGPIDQEVLSDLASWARDNLFAEDLTTPQPTK